MRPGKSKKKKYLRPAPDLQIFHSFSFQDTGFAETGRSVDSINLNTISGSRIRSSKVAGFDAADGDGPVQNEVECGVTKHRAFNKRIIGGKKAKFAELPWQVRSE